jgi:hypothetical protein
MSEIDEFCVKKTDEDLSWASILVMLVIIGLLASAVVAGSAFYKSVFPTAEETSWLAAELGHNITPQMLKNLKNERGSLEEQFVQSMVDKKSEEIIAEACKINLERRRLREQIAKNIPPEINDANEIPAIKAAVGAKLAQARLTLKRKDEEFFRMREEWYKLTRAAHSCNLPAAGNFIEKLRKYEKSQTNKSKANAGSTSRSGGFFYLYTFLRQPL